MKPADKDGMTITVDPFLGKCIHGLDGARFINGVRLTPDCFHCQLMENIRLGRPTDAIIGRLK